MGIRIYLVNSLPETAESIQCEVEPDERFSGLMETAAGYWGLQNAGELAIKHGPALASPGQRVSEMDVKEGDRLVVVRPDAWLADGEAARDWLSENIGGAPGSLELLESHEMGGGRTRYSFCQSGETDEMFRVVVEGGKAVKYRPV